MQQLLALGRLAVVYLALELLHLDPRNPRLHSKRQIKQIAQSIEAFGFVVPILIDRNNRVVAGSGRYQAAQLLGLPQVPTIRLEHLSDAQAKAFRLADNRLNEISRWDNQLLGETLDELCRADIGFNVEATGFDMGEIDLRIDALNQAATPKEPEACELPAGTPVSKARDLWIAGSHRVLCGNALDIGNFEILMADQRAAMVFVDPPYNVPIHGHASGLGRIQHNEFAMASGEMGRPQFTAFLNHAFILLIRHSVDGALLFSCIDWRHLSEILTAASLADLRLINLCVWTKPTPGMGSFYRSHHELIPVFRAGSRQHRNNIELGRHGRNRSNVWSYPSPQFFGRATEEGHLAALHPTVKPVQLVADAILDCSARGDIVLDSFLGSGTTLIAAERTGRRCYGMEIDPRYVDTIIRRWQAHTGGTAHHALTGLSFDATAGSRDDV